MNQAEKDEIRLRAAELRRRYSVRELRELFKSREHDTLFSYIGEAIVAWPDPRMKHILAWEGFAVAVDSPYNAITLSERYRTPGEQLETDDD